MRDQRRSGGCVQAKFCQDLLRASARFISGDAAVSSLSHGGMAFSTFAEISNRSNVPSLYFSVSPGIFSVLMINPLGTLPFRPRVRLLIISSPDKEEKAGTEKTHATIFTVEGHRRVHQHTSCTHPKCHPGAIR